MSFLGTQVVITSMSNKMGRKHLCFEQTKQINSTFSAQMCLIAITTLGGLDVWLKSVCMMVKGKWLSHLICFLENGIINVRL